MSTTLKILYSYYFRDSSTPCISVDYHDVCWSNASESERWNAWKIVHSECVH